MMCQEVNSLIYTPTPLSRPNPISFSALPAGMKRQRLESSSVAHTDRFASRFQVNSDVPADEDAPAGKLLLIYSFFELPRASQPMWSHRTFPQLIGAPRGSKGSTRVQVDLFQFRPLRVLKPSTGHQNVSFLQA